MNPKVVSAAKRGDAAAQFYVGSKLIGHYLVERENTDEALDWLKKSHAQGHAEATAKIAIIYKAHGKKSAIDPVKALKYLHLAEERGAERAPSRLAEMYFLGKGTIQDSVEAYAWISVGIAISNSEKMTKQMRKGKEQIENTMSERELIKGKKTANKYFSKFQKANEKWKNSKLYLDTVAYYKL